VKLRETFHCSILCLCHAFALGRGFIHMWISCVKQCETIDVPLRGSLLRLRRKSFCIELILLD
jgi:hypothetical protein